MLCSVGIVVAVSGAAGHRIVGVWLRSATWLSWKQLFWLLRPATVGR